MLKNIGMMILRAVYGAIVEMIRDKQLQKANDRVKLLEGYIDSKARTEATEQELRDKLAALEAAQAKVKDMSGKLESIRKFNGRA